MSWQGRVALVTGGKAGIGRAYAEALVDRGCLVVITAKSEAEGDVLSALASLDERARAVGAPSPRAIAWNMQVSDADAGVDAALRSHGVAVDIVVHAAHAFAPHKLIFATTPSDLEASLRANVVAPFALLRRVGRGMARRGFGRVLVVGSLAASMGGVGQATYIAEKSALQGLVRAFAVELGPRGVLVNMVEPSIVDTAHVRHAVSEEVLSKAARRSIVGRLATPADVVNATMGLLDPDSGFVTGQVIRVAGGLDLLSGASGDA